MRNFEQNTPPINIENSWNCWRSFRHAIEKDFNWPSFTFPNFRYSFIIKHRLNGFFLVSVHYFWQSIWSILWCQFMRKWFHYSIPIIIGTNSVYEKKTLFFSFIHFLPVEFTGVDAQINSLQNFITLLSILISHF